MMGLTEMQSRCLGVIRDGIVSNGRAPSYDEMMVALGIASKSGVSRLIEGLEERGAIRRLPGRARAIEIIEHRTCPHCGGRLDQ